MRKYTLASAQARGDVDLRDYADVIIEAVQSIMPEANVRIERDCYYVSPAPKKGDAVRIGRQICKSSLCRYCVQIPKLFSSVEVEDEKNDNRKEQHHGGHH